MTRVTVYSTGLVLFLAATAMTIAAIFLPNWVSWETNDNGYYTKTIGLHRSCSSVDHGCKHFPQVQDCRGSDRYFCSMWRSVGFMMSFAAVLEFATLVAYVVVIAGGRQKRESGWKILSFLLALVGVIQCAAMSIVAYLFDNDERFFVGWKLDQGWILCVASWSISILSAAGLALSAFVLPSEGGYELIPSERFGR